MQESTISRDQNCSLLYNLLKLFVLTLTLGPVPDVDYVLSICLQSNLPIMEQPASIDVNKFKPRDRQHGKRKDADSI